MINFLLNSHGNNKQTARKNLPSIAEFYEARIPIYEKYPISEKSKSMATFIIDSKSILKQDLKRDNALTSQAKGLFPPSKNRIEFNSSFESGNPFRVYQKEYNEYDLILQNDVNTRGNNQWFFFSVKNVPKNMTIKFNILNLGKKNSLFDMGMKPYTFSLGRF